MYSGMSFRRMHQHERCFMKTTEKKSFNIRAFVSSVMFAAGLVLPVSGLMNHNLQFAPLTLERHFWMAAHNMSALLFVVFTVIHVAFNRRALLHHLKKAGGKINREVVLALLFVAVIVGLFSSHAFHVR
jgi:hypothetical protein